MQNAEWRKTALTGHVHSVFIILHSAFCILHFAFYRPHRVRIGNSDLRAGSVSLPNRSTS
jgi:hypothetical protein